MALVFDVSLDDLIGDIAAAVAKGSPEIRMITLSSWLDRKQGIVMMDEVPNGTDVISEMF